jgi:hypothetical protein
LGYVQQCFGLLTVLVLYALAEVPAQAAGRLVALYPLGGQQGTALEVEVRGSGLEGTDTVWLGAGSRLVGSRAAAKCTKSPDGVEAQVAAVPDGSRVKVRLVIAPGARVGFHTLGLISPAGLSNALSFWVGPHAVVQESGDRHNTPDTAQAVPLPVAINGHISASGELDYYAFPVEREQTVAFEVIALHGAAFDPQVALYEAGGSLLDSQRCKRLVFREEITQGGMPANRRMTYHFTKPGRYLVNVGTPFTRTGGDCAYLLRIAPAERPPATDDALAWARGRLQGIRSRTVGAPAADVDLVREVEPNDSQEQAKVFKLPAVLEGTVGRPGDVDWFRFKAKAGEKLVFESQTPRAGPPHFTPRLDVLDARGAVVLTNLRAQEGKVGTESAKVIQFTSQVMGKLERQGEYTLRIRDLTSVRGSPEHVYRVLVRPQIAHLGDVQLQPGGPVSLRPGARQRLTVSAPAQEGFAGLLALSVEGLPQGVSAFVGANNALIELVAETSAPATALPQMLRVSGMALAGGKSGLPFLVAEVPIMVLKK